MSDGDAFKAELEAIEAEERALKARRAAIAPEEVKAEEEAEQAKWPHQFLEFEGETWEVRHPKPGALFSVSMATSRHNSPTVQQNEMVKFFSRHMSEACFERLRDRMGDPDDDFDQPQLDEFMQLLIKGAGSRPTSPS
jgi:hypothetical protein